MEVIISYQAAACGVYDSWALQATVIARNEATQKESLTPELLRRSSSLRREARQEGNLYPFFRP